MINPVKQLPFFVAAHRTWISLLDKTARGIIILAGILWSLDLITIMIFGYDRVARMTAELLNLPATQFLTPAAPWSNPALNNIFLSLYTPFLVISGFATILGTLILSPNRSLWEIVMLFVGGAIPRQRKYWGLVFDQKTNKPVAFAVIRILQKEADETYTEVGKTVTDLDGRYRMYLPIKNKNYRLEVQSEGYQPFVKEIDYRHQKLIESALIEDIPLVENASAQDSFKSFFYTLRPKLYPYVMYFLFLFTEVASVWALYGLVVYFYLDTLTFMLIYGSSFIWNCITIYDRIKNKTGKVIDEKNKRPLAGALVQVFNDNKQILAIVSDQEGVVKFDLKPGDYIVKVYKENYTVSENSAETSLTVHITNQGYLSRDIHLYPVSENGLNTLLGNSLANPFAEIF